MDIKVKADLREITRGLRAYRRQIPFATAVALTRTANDVKDAEQKQINKQVDRPVRFTVNAIGIRPANKRTLTAEVFVKTIQARYLRYQIEGGIRRGKGGITGVPTRNQKLNQYGNIPGRRRKAPAWRQGKTTTAKTFIATIKGVRGVWERYGRGGRQVRLLVAFEQRVRYRKRLDFYGAAEATVNKRFAINFARAFNSAVAAAR